MSYTIKELAKLWNVDRSTALRRVKKGNYHTELKEVIVEQKQKVLFVDLGVLNDVVSKSKED